MRDNGRVIVQKFCLFFLYHKQMGMKMEEKRNADIEREFDYADYADEVCTDCGEMGGWCDMGVDEGVVWLICKCGGGKCHGKV